MDEEAERIEISSHRKGIETLVEGGLRLWNISKKTGALDENKVFIPLEA